MLTTSASSANALICAADISSAKAPVRFNSRFMRSPFAASRFFRRVAAPSL
jgi:hypothetical protein